MHDTREKWDHTIWRIHNLGRRSSGECEKVKCEVLRRDEKSESIERDQWEMKEITPTLYIDKYATRWISRYRKVSRIKIHWTELLSSYREVSTAKWRRWIEKLLRIYWAYRNFLNGSRSCREAIETNSQKSRCIDIARTTIEKGSLRGSIDSIVIERCPAVVKIA